MSAWTVIAHTEVGSGGAANIEFTSIPGTYTDLVILVSDRSNRSATNDALIVEFNNTGSSGRRLYGTGTTATSDASAYPLNTANTSTSNTFSNIQIYVANYADTTKNKNWFSDSVTENNGTNGYQAITASVYASNSAITSVKLRPETGNALLQYSSATLYGVTKGSSGGVSVS